jgi:hypothetical protein
MKLPRFLKDFGQISSFLLLKSEYFQKQLPHLKENNYKIGKVFKGFWVDL